MMFEPKIHLTTRGVRWLYAIVAVVILVAFGTYVSSRLKTTYRLSYVLEKHLEEYRAYRGTTDANLESLATRLNELERTMPWLAATRATTPKAAAVPQSWQLNRDLELRKRMQDQGREMYEQQGQISELQRKIRELERQLRDR